jgi:N-acetylneuraminic acid mutarotase
MVVMGGYSPHPSKSRDITVHKSVEAYDMKSDNWTSLAPMKEARYAAASAVLDHYLYVFGGIGSDDNVLQSVERYDSTQNAWQIMDKLRLPCKLAFATVVVVESEKGTASGRRFIP